MSEVVAALQRDHANFGKLLDLLERQIAVFDEGARPDYDVIQGIIEYCLNYPDLYHHPKEDLILERLRRRAPEVLESVGELDHDHRHLTTLVRQLQTAVGNVLQEAEIERESVDHVARDLIKAYRAHMDMEERTLLPAAVEHLSESDWAEIEGALSHREDPLFGAETEERFEALRKDILAWADDAA